MEGNLLKVRYFQERQSACCAYSSPNQDDINALMGFDLYVTNVDVEAPASPEAPMRERRRIKRFVRVRREIPLEGEQDESSSEKYCGRRHATALRGPVGGSRQHA